MYVIYPADEVVSLTYIAQALPRPRQRPTLDILYWPTPPTPDRALPPPPDPPAPPAPSPPKTAPPENAERAPASPTPSLERPAKLRERTKAKFLKRLGRQENNEFGKIVRTPAPDEFELPAPLPTPAFSRKNIFDRDFDALFEVASTPEFCANIRVVTPEPDHRSDVTAAHFPSPSSSSSLNLLPPRPHSEPVPRSSPTPSVQTSLTTPPSHRSSLEGSNSKPKKVSFFRRKSRAKEKEPSPVRNMMPQPSIEMALRELTHPTHNDQLKNQQQVTFKLVKTVWIFSVALIYKYLFTFREDTIRFTTRNDYLNWNTTFPSITVCETPNIDRMSAKIPEFIQNNLTIATFAREVVFFNGQCTSCLSLCENGECYNSSALMNSVVRSECKELFHSCTWNNKPMNCCQHFQQIQTEYGKCYTMNNNHIYQENKDNYYVANSTSRRLGGLQLSLAQEVEIFLHSSNDIPYWNIEHDRRVVVSPTSQATILFSIVDIINDPEVSLIESDERQCRFPDELPDNYIGYKLYSYSVCIIHCRIEAQIELCNCTSHLSPKEYKERYCDLEGLKCLTKNYEKLKKLKVPGLNESALNCDCLSSCVESDYHIVSRRVSEAGKGSIGTIQYVLSNRPYERITRQVAKTTLDLVVAMGSCFGLFFGGSLLSIVEFFYYICFKQWKFTKV